MSNVECRLENDEVGDRTKYEVLSLKQDFDSEATSYIVPCT